MLWLWTRHDFDLFFTVLDRSKNELDKDEFMFFLTGGVGLENKLANPAPTWLTDKSWDEICRLSDMKKYKKFRSVMRCHVKRTDLFCKYWKISGIKNLIYFLMQRMQPENFCHCNLFRVILLKILSLFPIFIMHIYLNATILKGLFIISI